MSAVQIIGDQFSDDPGSMSEQLAETIREAPYPVAYNRRADLRGTLEDSHILVFRSPYFDRIEQSDELRIYDEDGGILRLHLGIRPAPRDVPRGRLEPPNPGLQFDIERIVDLDGNGAKDIVGAFSLRAMGPYNPRPVVITWDPGSGTYKIYPVLNARVRFPNAFPLGHPPLARLYEPGDWAESARRSYLRPLRIVDSDAGVAFTSYAVEDFILRRGRRSYVVVAGFTVAAKAHADNPTVMQVYAYGLRFDLDPAQYSFGECSSVGGADAKPILVHLRRTRFEGTEFALDRAWSRIRHQVFC